MTSPPPPTSVKEVKWFAETYQAENRRPYPRFYLLNWNKLTEANAATVLDQVYFLFLKFKDHLESNWENAEFRSILDSAGAALTTSYPLVEGVPSLAYVRTKPTVALPSPVQLNLRGFFSDASGLEPAATTGRDLVYRAYRKQKSELRRRQIYAAVSNEIDMAQASILNSVDNFPGGPGADPDDFLEALDGAFNLIQSSPVPGGGELPALEDAYKCNTLRLKLRSEARAWVRSEADLATLNNWDQLKARFLARFRPAASLVQLQNLFKNCVQRYGESPAAFATRLRAAGQEIAKARPVTAVAAEQKARRELMEYDILAQFLNGLLPSIARFVNARSPTTIAAAIKAADEETISEQVEQARAAPRVAAVRFTEPPARTGPREQAAPKPSNSASDRGACFRCNATDHWADRCPQRPRNQRRGGRGRQGQGGQGNQASSGSEGRYASPGRAAPRDAQYRPRYAAGPSGSGHTSNMPPRPSSPRAGFVAACQCRCSCDAARGQADTQPPRSGRNGSQPNRPDRQ